jgi:hypothetical protein
MEAGRFPAHVRRTYFTLRFCMGLSALVFPVVLALGGWVVADLPYQPSLSDYYYTRMGDVFVGMLIAIGASLTVYAGYSRQENWVLNLAGVLAVTVALVPPLRDLQPASHLSLATSSFWHGAAALAFFAAIGWVCIFRARDTLELIPNGLVVRRYRQLYGLLGVLMIAAPVGALLLSAALDAGRMVFWAEAFAVWVFAAYWLTKTYELRRSRGDEKLMAQRGGESAV